jgi:hypothetical protein
MNLLPKKSLRVLLVHVLETLSPRNRETLLKRFAARLPASRLFSLTPDGPQPLPDHA